MNRKKGPGPVDGTAVIESYVAFLALEPGQPEWREQLELVVKHCYKQHGPWLYEMLRRQMNLGHEDAEDRLQELFHRFAGRLEAGQDLPDPNALAAWLRVGALHLAFSHFRRNGGTRRRAEIESALGRFDLRPKSPQEIVSLKELSGAVAEILRTKATKKMRRVFRLRMRDKTYKEIVMILKGGDADAYRYLYGKVVALLLTELTRLGWSSD